MYTTTIEHIFFFPLIYCIYKLFLAVQLLFSHINIMVYVNWNVNHRSDDFALPQSKRKSTLTKNIREYSLNKQFDSLLRRKFSWPNTQATFQGRINSSNASIRSQTTNASWQELFPSRVVFGHLVVTLLKSRSALLALLQSRNRIPAHPSQRYPLLVAPNYARDIHTASYFC